MELIVLVKEVFQSAAEQAASYKMGQSLLRHVDKALWVVEKCARWAVPPPLDPEERPQPELVRPLPWVFFLMMLVTLRVTRETISLINLVLGKPPLRSADVVTYIQGKRRYLRTLKYQGNRMMRARKGSAQEPWHSSLKSLFEFTMCFRRQSVHYGNNNTTSVSNNDEVLVVKRSKRVRQSDGAAAGEASMERLIEKMMVDLDADSADDSSYTLTNATSIKSDRSDMAESDQEANQTVPAPSTPKPELHDETATPSKSDTPPKTATPSKSANLAKSATATKSATVTKSASTPAPDTKDISPKEQTPPKPKADPPKPGDTETATKEPVTSTPEKSPKTSEEVAIRPSGAKKTPLLDTMAFIQNEKQPLYLQSPKKEKKMANGRTVKSTSDRNIGGERRDPDSIVRASSADFNTRGRKENVRQTP